MLNVHLLDLYYLKIGEIHSIQLSFQGFHRRFLLGLTRHFQIALPFSIVVWTLSNNMFNCHGTVQLWQYDGGCVFELVELYMPYMQSLYAPFKFLLIS